MEKFLEMETVKMNIEFRNEFLPVFESIFKQFKVKSKLLEKPETYSKELAEKIRQARKERTKGETIKISSENLWEAVK